MADLTTGLMLGVVAGAWLGWLCCRPRHVRRVYRVPARDRLGWLDPARFDDIPDRPWRDWLPSDTVAEHLAAWDREVDGLPWGTACDFAPAEVLTDVDDRGATVHRIVPHRPSTAMVRALVEAR